MYLFGQSKLRDLTIAFLVAFVLFAGGCNSCSEDEKDQAKDGSYCAQLQDPQQREECEVKHKELRCSFCEDQNAMGRGFFNGQSMAQFCGTCPEDKSDTKKNDEDSE